MGKKIISITLDENIKDEITQRASLENRSLSNMLEHTIKDYLERERKKDKLISEYEAIGYFGEKNELKEEIGIIADPQHKKTDMTGMETDSKKERIDVVQQPEEQHEEQHQEKTLLEQINQGKGGIDLNNITHKF